MTENVLFWTLCIGSAIIAVALVAQAWAGATLFASIKTLRTSALQLASGTAQLGKLLHKLVSQSHPQWTSVSNEIRSATRDVTKMSREARDSWRAFSGMTQRLRDKAGVTAGGKSRRA